MPMKTKRSPTGCTAVDPVIVQIMPFLSALRDTGYSEYTLQIKRGILNTFTKWLRHQSIPVQGVNEGTVVAFIKCRPGKGKARIGSERTVLLAFLAFLRNSGTISTPPIKILSTDDLLLQRYSKYLMDERGLLDRTIKVYLGLIRIFLAGAAFKADSRSPGCWDAQIVRNFLLGVARARSNKSVHGMATALRSFFRFLYQHDETAANLALAVPMVRKWRQAGIPPHLTSEQIEKTLATADRSTSRGRRDYAILTLLARLGLRAGEVARLELADIHWRTGEILIHGKGRRIDCLPLLADIGEALADYLQKDRGKSVSRMVFLRIQAPHIGLEGASGISQIVGRAFAHAGIRPGERVGAHLFRHSLATRMIRHGASIPEISAVPEHNANICKS